MSLPSPKKEEKEDGFLGPHEMGMFPLSIWILCRRQQDNPGDIGGKGEWMGIKLKEEKGKKDTSKPPMYRPEEELS